PIVDLSLGRVTGAEALIRWQHPERGMVPPLQFIGVAEQSGLIDPIGLWVMRQACRQVKDWADAGLPGMKIAVNLSARQFLDPGLIDSIREALGNAGIAANQLEIELTETAAMADAAHTSAVFGKLRDLGVRIAIDDFGTGYASMSYLRKLPFDKLKIDREFVSNVQSTRDSQAICGALVTLANGLGWSPDGGTMYFSDTHAGTIWAYDYDIATGAIADRRAFATVPVEEGVPDGLTVDAAGRVVVAIWRGGRLDVHAPNGAREASIPVPVRNPTSCAFGDADLRTLYVTTMPSSGEDDPRSGSLFATTMDVPGLAGVPMDPTL
uniref:EAL domain-containing protein n=1 Tax=Sphingomonas bacterium TaxID=1895847 RepID=UPI0015754D49